MIAWARPVRRGLFWFFTIHNMSGANNPFGDANAEENDAPEDAQSELSPYAGISKEFFRLSRNILELPGNIFPSLENPSYSRHVDLARVINGF